MIKPPKPPFLPRFKPERLPKARRMTIVLGMLNDGGIVLAADTEETADLKRDASKLEESFNSHGSRLVVGGAGSADHIETMAEHLSEAFTNATAKNVGSLTKQFRGIIQSFYKDHVLCWPSLTEREDSDFSLLIGAALRAGKDSHEFRLWIAQKGMLRSVRGFRGHDAIGNGRTYANNLMDRRRLGQSLAEDILTAIYVTRQVKRDVPYCGKDTEVVCFGWQRVLVGARKHD